MKEPRSNTRNVCSDCVDKARAAHQAKRVEYHPGDYVKAAFSDPKEVLRAEHMWVKVEEVLENSIKGTLNNDPVVWTHLKDGDQVEVMKDQISDHIPVSEPGD